MTQTRMEARIEVLERNMERGERTRAELREQAVLICRKVDLFQSQLERIEQIIATMALQRGSQPLSTGAGESGDSGGDKIGENRSFISARNVELPSFRGEDPLSWLTKAEQNFSIQNTADSMKIHCTRKIERELEALGTWSMANDKEEPHFGLGDRNEAELGRSTSSTLSGPQTNIYTASSTNDGGSLTLTASSGSKPNPRNSVAGNSASATLASSGAGFSGSRPSAHRLSSSAIGGVERFRSWKPEMVYQKPESKTGDLPIVTSQRLTGSGKKKERKRLQQEKKIPLYRPLCQLRLVESKNRTKQGKNIQLKREKRKHKKRRNRVKEKKILPGCRNEQTATPVPSTVKAYSIADLQVATESFSVDNFVGERAFGCMFRAQLGDDKKLDSSAVSSCSEDFTEIVSNAFRLHHLEESALWATVLSLDSTCLSKSFKSRGLYMNSCKFLPWNDRGKGTLNQMESSTLL